jgi:hypothetical protein
MLYDGIINHEQFACHDFLLLAATTGIKRDGHDLGAGLIQETLVYYDPEY